MGDRLSHSAELGFSPKTGHLELVVPHGTKFADLGKILSQIDLSAVARLPRGCGPCISGHPFNIRERFEEVISVALPHLDHQAGQHGG
ncbi:MAG TPA: hypothetical protein VNT42_04715 [Sphingomonas sp.]|nr:hypothetical protein [Sphingomonas sp.]